MVFISMLCRLKRLLELNIREKIHYWAKHQLWGELSNWEKKIIPISNNMELRNKIQYNLYKSLKQEFERVKTYQIQKLNILNDFSMKLALSTTKL